MNHYNIETAGNEYFPLQSQFSVIMYVSIYSTAEESLNYDPKNYGITTTKIEIKYLTSNLSLIVFCLHIQKYAFIRVKL